MNIMKKLKSLIITFLSMFGMQIGYSQGLTYSLERRIINSDLILEGEVVERFAYEANGNIYTANKINVCKVHYQQVESLKIPSDYYVITCGGNLDSIQQYCSHKLDLDIGDTGFFYLKKENLDIPQDIGGNPQFCKILYDQRGFIRFEKDDNYNLSFNDNNRLFQVQEVIDSLNYYIQGNSSTGSCIWNGKSGLLLNIGEEYIVEDTIFVNIGLSGMWGKNYDLEKTILEIDLGSNINLSNYNLMIKPMSNTLTTNYQRTWSQPSMDKLVIKVQLNNINVQRMQINNSMQSYIQIGILKSALLSTSSFNGISISQARFLNSQNQSIDFEEIELEDNTNIFGLKPVFGSFAPETVGAGLTMDEALESNQKGYIIIYGENFGDFPEDSLDDHIPWTHSVRFERAVGEKFSSKFKVVPDASHYEYWNDDEIKVYIPTYGYKAHKKETIKKSDDLKIAPAVTGSIHIQVGKKYDDIALPGEKSDVKVEFGLFNQKRTIYGDDNEVVGFKTEANRYPDNIDAENGAYQFVFDESFNDINYGSVYPLSSYKQAVKDAFCAWNLVNEIPIEIVEECDNDIFCG